MELAFFLYPAGAPPCEQLPARVVDGRVYVAHLNHVVTLADAAALDFLEPVDDWDDASRALIRTLPAPYAAAFAARTKAGVVAGDASRLPPPPAARTVTVGGQSVDMTHVVREIFTTPAAKKSAQFSAP
jgi:hypothetical protein